MISHWITSTGTTMAGIIHAIMLATHVFGQGVQTVLCTGDQPFEVMQLAWPDRPDRPACGVTINTNIGAVPHCAFYASAFGSRGSVHSPAMGDYEFPFGAAEILRTVRQMVNTRKTPESLALMVEGIAIAEAARISKRIGQAVGVDEVTGGKLSDCKDESDDP